MPQETTLEESMTECFRADLPRIKRLGKTLEAKERKGFRRKHVVSWLLDLGERELGIPPNVPAT